MLIECVMDRGRRSSNGGAKHLVDDTIVRYLCAIRNSPYMVAIDYTDSVMPRTDAGREGAPLSMDPERFR